MTPTPAPDGAVQAMLLAEARRERDALQQRALALRGERDAARAEVERLRAERDELHTRWLGMRDAYDVEVRREGDARREVEGLRAENGRQLRHLKVWQRGYQEATVGARLRATGDAPAKVLLADILAVVNQHQGCSAEQAMAEIHDVLAAHLDATPIPKGDR